jgi:hypothetical protein
VPRGLRSSATRAPSIVWAPPKAFSQESSTAVQGSMGVSCQRPSRWRHQRGPVTRRSIARSPIAMRGVHDAAARPPGAWATASRWTSVAGL